MDDHFSHCDSDMIKKFASMGLFFFFLPPNSSDMTQMMDRKLNKDTKKIRHDTTQKWLYDSPGKTPGRSELIYFFLTTAHKALNKNNIKAA